MFVQHRQRPAAPLALPTVALLCDGEYGPFEGPEHDQVVFGTYRRTGRWSPELVELIAGRLFDGGEGTLIDVGANLGLISIPVAARSRARCLAFEPAPDNHACLRGNVARHGLQARIEPHALALSDGPGRAQLRLSPNNGGDHHLRAASEAGADDGGPSVRVQTAALDELLRGRALRGPVVMKVDTQGAEARVLRGARRTLERVDWLIVEYWPAGLLRMGESVAALHAELQCFSHATVLDQQTPPRALQPREAALASLAWIPTDGSDEGFFDLLLGRSAALPSPRAQ